MDLPTFERLFDHQIEKCISVMGPKNRDYSRETEGGDAVGNFKADARDLGLDPMEVWAVHWNKHTRAIKTFVRTGVVESEPVGQRFTDAINYLILGLALGVDLGRIENPFSERHDGRAAKISGRRGAAVGCLCHGTIDPGTLG